MPRPKAPLSYVQLEPVLLQHPKFLKFKRLLGVDVDMALAKFTRLVFWVAQYSPYGDLTKFDDGEIADGCGWDGDPVTLMKALTEAGFLDQIGEEVHFHDWYETYGNLLERRERATNKKRKERQEKKAEVVPGTSSGRHGGVPTESRVEDSREEKRKSLSPGQPRDNGKIQVMSP